MGHAKGESPFHDVRSQGGEIRVAKCKVDQQCNVFKNPQMLKLRSMEAPESDRARFTVGVADDIEPVLIKEDRQVSNHLGRGTVIGSETFQNQSRTHRAAGITQGHDGDAHPAHRRRQLDRWHRDSDGRGRRWRQ